MQPIKRKAKNAKLIRYFIAQAEAPYVKTSNIRLLNMYFLGMHTKDCREDSKVEGKIHL